MNHDLTTHAGQIANIKAVKARIAAAAYRPPLPKPRIVSSSDWTKRPMWMSDDIQFDDHIMRYQRYKATAIHIRWLRNRCNEMDASYQEVVGYSRSRDIIPVRFQLMWEMRNLLNISLPQIGKAFGGRDHTSAYHAIKTWQEQIDGGLNAND